MELSKQIAYQQHWQDESAATININVCTTSVTTEFCLGYVVDCSKCLDCLKDRELLEPMLMPLVIIGSKYDVFQVSVYFHSTILHVFVFIFDNNDY